MVAVIDSGVDRQHPDLLDNLWTNPGETAGDNIDNDNNTFVDDVNGWDFDDNDNSPDPGGSHGTAVAGCVGGRGDNGVGVSGSAQRCRIMVLRSSSGTVADDALAFDYARAMGAAIITNSWGYPIGTPTTTVVETAINNAATTGRGGSGASCSSP